jgi:hypothetical protein
LLIALENRVLRRIFGPKREDVTGGWRKVHNEEILCSSPTIMKTNGVVKVKLLAF